jgi:RimJ/RimL family protein N-acetyltransferase
MLKYVYMKKGERTMLSFKMLSENIIKEIVEVAEIDKEMIEDTLMGILENSDDDFYGATTIANGTLLVRIFDYGRYSFIYPVPIEEDYDIVKSITDIIDYATLEELTPTFTDVPREDLGYFAETFRHLKIDATDPYGAYTVVLRNECDMLSYLPNISHEESEWAIKNAISLREIEPESTEDYARLCKDKELNKYWGYDYTEDNADAADDYFLSVAEDEFNRGVAIILGIYLDEQFVGEASIYGFDYKGGAKCGVRVLPEQHRKGIATDAMNLLKSLAKNISLTQLTFECMVENKPSFGLLSQIAEHKNTDNCKHTFTYSLFNE